MDRRPAALVVLLVAVPLVAATGLFTLGVVAVAVGSRLGLFVVGPAVLVALVGLVAAVLVDDSTPTGVGVRTTADRS